MGAFLRHVLFWTGVFLLWAYLKSGGSFIPELMWLTLWSMPIYMGIYYVLYYVQIPYLYNRGKLTAFVLSVFGSMAVVYLLWQISGIYLFGKVINEAYSLETIQSYVPAMGLLAWESFRTGKEEAEKRQLLEKEKLESELKLLKTQLSPHFLFNTLNSLYERVVNKSPEAPDMIMQLSNVLDYILYKSQRSTVVPEEELAVIENFIHLEQKRFPEQVETELEVSNTYSVSISPMLLLSLVREEFKKVRERNGSISKISIKEKNKVLHCEVEHSGKEMKKQQYVFEENAGPGDLKAQLDLLYPGNNGSHYSEKVTDTSIGKKDSKHKIGFQKAQFTFEKIVYHLLFWIAVYVFYTGVLSVPGNFERYWRINSVTVPLFMSAYYLIRYVQIPLLLDEGKKLLFGISLLLSSVLLFGVYLVAWYLWLGEALGYGCGVIPLISGGGYTLMSIRFYSPALVLLVWEFNRERRKDTERVLKLEKEKKATEIKFLKAQINPHFLFNTLNNLYSYVVTESPKAPEMIIGLSKVLDYVLNKSQNKTVPLKEEVEIIESYIKLEQVRYGERLEVDYRTEGELILPISPLILLSLVENAFKHGASGDIDNPKIKIDLKETSDTIMCRVWNTKSKYKGELNDAYKKGIGLSNIKRQLSLVYPTNHQLIIDDLESEFVVSLNIKPMT